jgi:hypothetical protein
VLHSKTISPLQFRDDDSTRMWAKGKQVTYEYIGKYSHQEFQTPFNNLKKLASGHLAGNRRKTVAMVLSKKVGSTSCINFNRDTPALHFYWYHLTRTGSI